MIYYKEHSIVWLRHLDAHKIGTEEFGKVQNVELEDNEEDKMLNKNN